MASPLQNVWHLRTVGEASSKPCFICYKPTTRVMITPDNKDFFYICAGHLNDKGFASPIIDAETAAAKEKEEAKKREVEKVIQEYEEKQRKKKEKRKAKADAKDKDDDKAKKKADADTDSKEEKERDEKIKSIEDAATASTASELPRVYALHRNFYHMRLDRLRNVELAKKNQQRLKDPTVFPSAPKGDLQ